MKKYINIALCLQNVATRTVKSVRQIYVLNVSRDIHCIKTASVWVRNHRTELIKSFKRVIQKGEIN